MCHMWSRDQPFLHPLFIETIYTEYKMISRFFRPSPGILEQFDLKDMLKSSFKDT